MTEDIGRGYNDSHVAVAYWALYRVGRRDPLRRLWLTLEAGTFRQIKVNTRTNAVRVELARNTAGGASRSGTTRLRLEQPAQVAGVGMYRPRITFAREHDADTIPAACFFAHDRGRPD